MVLYTKCGKPPWSLVFDGVGEENANVGLESGVWGLELLMSWLVSIYYALRQQKLLHLTKCAHCPNVELPFMGMNMEDASDDYISSNIEQLPQAESSHG